jgi:hypothetical protein
VIVLAEEVATVRTELSEVRRQVADMPSSMIMLADDVGAGCYYADWVTVFAYIRHKSSKLTEPTGRY